MDFHKGERAGINSQRDAHQHSLWQQQSTMGWDGRQ
jgi:hypothetical protein